MATLAPERASGRGILLLLGAMFLLATMDAVNKLLVETYSIPQILWIRFGIFLVFALLWTRTNPITLARSSVRPGLQLFRGAVLVGEIGIFILAFSYLPLADTHAIAATSPLIVTVLSIPLLGERVGRHRWVAVGVGFIGALVIIRPGFSDAPPAVIFAVIAAFVFAFYQILSRMVAVDPGRVTLIYTSAVGFVILCFISPFFWQPVALEDWPLILFSGILGACGHFALIKAFEAAPASSLQPFSYSLLIFAAIAGWVVFDHIPDLYTILGAVIVTGSGLYVFHRESRG